MKLSVLFARYLYQQKELNLPGIGSFTIDPKIPIPEPSDKQFSEYIQQIKFVQKPVSKPDDSFIDFIRVQTGKIRPLAESDLDSFLSDGKILLNIGKPFHFEGIGSLMKTRDGKYEFTPGIPLSGKADAFTADKITDKKVENASPVEQGYEDDGGSSKKTLITLSILIGLIAVVWGGYYLYNRNTPDQIENNTPVTPVETPDTNSSLLATDTTTIIPGADTTIVSSTPTSAAGTYKFIIESTNSKARALKRYNQLKSYYIKVDMDANADSTSFKLYFNLPASPSDTSRIKDSLGRMYARKVIVEQ